MLRSSAPPAARPPASAPAGAPPSDPPTADRALELADRLRPLLLQLGRHMRRELGPLGLAPGQVTLLATVRDRPGIGVGDLAEREKMSAPSMVGHIDRLQRAGLVTRARADADRRRVGLRITADGHRLLRRIRWRRTAWLADRLRGLDAADLAALDAAAAPLARLVEGRRGPR